MMQSKLNTSAAETGTGIVTRCTDEEISYLPDRSVTENDSQQKNAVLTVQLIQ